MNFECRTIKKERIVMVADKDSDIHVNVKEALLVSIIENTPVHLRHGEGGICIVNADPLIDSILNVKENPNRKD